MYRCFELDPSAEKNITDNLYEKLSKKYGMSIEQAKASSENVTRMAKEVGLEYHLDTVVLTNTFDAHRVAMLAKYKGLMNEVTERILRAYYTESANIGDHDTLVKLAAEVGLDSEEVAKMLSSDELSDAVRADEQEAAELGIRSIPFFLINRKYAITGAQSSDIVLQSLKQIVEQDGPFTNVEGAACDDEGCEIPRK